MGHKTCYKENEPRNDKHMAQPEDPILLEQNPLGLRSEAAKKPVKTSLSMSDQGVWMINMPPVPNNG